MEFNEYDFGFENIKNQCLKFVANGLEIIYVSFEKVWIGMICQMILK